jgi:hypothetical protein
MGPNAICNIYHAINFKIDSEPHDHKLRIDLSQNFLMIYLYFSYIQYKHIHNRHLYLPYTHLRLILPVITCCTIVKVLIAIINMIQSNNKLE